MCLCLFQALLHIGYLNLLESVDHLERLIFRHVWAACSVVGLAGNDIIS